MYPYFYVMLIPSVIIAACLGLWLLQNYLKAQAVFILYFFVIAAFGSSGLYHYLIHSGNSMERQRQTINTIHRMFEHPVSYIDKCAMVPGFFKIGYFMSSAGREIYRQQKVPVIANAVNEGKPLFVLANNTQLQNVFRGGDIVDLFYKDQHAIRNNYIHHWDLIYIAGKTLEFGSDKTPVKTVFHIQGPYTIESTRGILVDGRRYPPGHVLHIKKDSIYVAPTHKHQKITFRWGDHIYKPDFAPASQPIFTGMAIL
jgi:hypothetical protein